MLKIVGTTSDVVGTTGKNKVVRFLKKIAQRTFIIILIVSWVFSGFPQIFDFRIADRQITFPPKIKRADAAISEASATTETSLSSTSYSVMDSMTITPEAGDYLAGVSAGVHPLFDQNHSDALGFEIVPVGEALGCLPSKSAHIPNNDDVEIPSLGPGEQG